MNQTVHTINLLVTMVGTPVEVFAYTACLAHERIEVEDTAVAVVKFASGALGMIHGTTAAYPGLDANLRIFGSKGSAVISNDELTFIHENVGPAPEIALSVRHRSQSGDRRLPTGSRRHRAGQRTSAPAGGLRHGRAAPTAAPGAPEDARTSLAVILGLYESAATGKPVAL